MKLNKKNQNFETLSIKLLSHGPFKKAPPIFSPVSNATSTFPTADELPGSVVQTKSKTTILWYAEHWPVTFLLIILL